MARPVLRMAVRLIVLLELTTVLFLRAEDETRSDGFQKVQEMKIEAPIMTEEDQYGYNMPDRYRCDACKAVVYHLNRTLVHRQPKSRRLKEWEYTELLDEICANEFEGYGIKFLNGENVLSGPALTDREQEVKPGGAMIQMGGDNWKKRMGEICRTFVYEKVGEDDLYQTFYKKGELSDSMCFGLGTRDCSKKASQKAKEAAGDKKKGAAEKLVRNGKEPKKQGKKDEKKEDKKEEKKKSLKGSTPAPAAKKAIESDHTVDVVYFLTQMAVEHGLPPTEYTKNRSLKEWERTMLALAGRIFGKGSSSVGTASEATAEEEAATLEV